MRYKIDLDGFCEEIFQVMEEISEGRSGHECVIDREDKDTAAEDLGDLLKPFFISCLEEE